MLGGVSVCARSGEPMLSAMSPHGHWAFVSVIPTVLERRSILPRLTKGMAPQVAFSPDLSLIRTSLISPFCLPCLMYCRFGEKTSRKGYI